MQKKGNAVTCRGLILIAAVVSALSGGCSPHTKGSRLSIQLVPKDSSHTAAQLFTAPTTLGNLNCFGLNIRGGNVPTSPSCNGNYQAGLTLGTVTSRPATFEADIVPGPATTFEAFGFMAASCPALGTVLSNGIPNDPVFNGYVYLIGAVTLDVTPVANKTITIPTSFNSNQGYRCGIPINRIATGGSNFACATNTNGNVYCWGINGSGQLGSAVSGSSSYPVSVSGIGGSGTLSDVNGISAGASHTCATNTAGNALCWGSNTNGQLGNNSTASQSSVPVQVTGAGGSGLLSNVTSVAAGSSATCAADKSGNTFCWGSGSSGELGYNSTVATQYPVQVVGVGGTGTLSGINSVTGGSGFSCAQSTSGNVYCWGTGSNGQLGNNSTSQSLVPVQVVGVGGTGALSSINAVAASATSSHACAVSSSGNVYCWGSANNGQLGNNSTSQSLYPVQVVGVGGTGVLGGITAISVGQSHSCGLDSSGTLYCWGLNTSSQLGDNSTNSQSNFPVVVAGVGGSGTLAAVKSAGAGSVNTCAVNSSGSVYCWGSSASGALGTGATSGSASPLQVLGVGGSGTLQL